MDLALLWGIEGTGVIHEDREHIGAEILKGIDRSGDGCFGRTHDVVFEDPRVGRIADI